jgi:hypothetical protein
MEPKKLPTKGVENEILKLQFPSDILKKACEIYRMLDIGVVPRDAKRSKIKCYCIFQAYIELDKQIIPDPCYIGKALDLNTFDSNLSITKRPSYKNGHIPKRIKTSPQLILNSYITNNMSLPDDIVFNINDTFGKVLASKPALLQEKPKPLVAAFILSYASYTGLGIDKDDLANVFYLEYNTIRSKLELVKPGVLEFV